MAGPPRKIAVIGTTASGKTTIARRLAEHDEVPHVELDALHWGPDWAEPTAEEFRARVEEALPRTGWVVDGGYHGKLGDLILERADLVVWLDPSLGTILVRLWARTLARIRRGDELWSGNRETWRGAFLSRDSLFLWALKTHRGRRRRYEKRLGRFNVVHLRSPQETEAWLREYLS